MRYVLDSSVLMAIVKQEPGAIAGREALSDGMVSAVNFAETLGKLALQGFDPDSAERELRGAGLSVSAVLDEDIAGVVALHQLAKRGISLADRFCLALAIRTGLPCLTGDRSWTELSLAVQVSVFR